MPLFEHGHFDGVSNEGWVIGHFAIDGHRTEAVEVKWAHHVPGVVGKGWSDCDTAATLAVLIWGRFRIDFEGGPIELVDLRVPGDYVLFGPGIRHCSTALE